MKNNYDYSCKEFKLEVDITRDDPRKQGYNREMTEEDMERLVEILAERYCEETFQEDLKRANENF